MRFIYPTSLVLLVVIISYNSFPQRKARLLASSELLGKWETVNLSPGMSITYEYMPGNRFKYMLTAGLNGKYRLSHNHLITTYEIPSLKNGQTDTSIILIRLDTLYQITVQKGREIPSKMVRLNGKPHPGAGIIGEWVSISGTRKNIINFNPNGTLELRNVLRNVSGKYLVKGDNITVVSRGTTIMNNRFAFDNGFLLLYTKNVSAPVKLKRIRN